MAACDWSGFKLWAAIPLWICSLEIGSLLAQEENKPQFTANIEVRVPPIRGDDSVAYDYDIVYVRAPRAGDEIAKRFFTDFSSPVTLEPGADLMLLHPDGQEELLVAGGEGSITDPVVSLDGRWVYYTHIHNLQKASQWNPPRQGADIYKINLQSRKIVKLTNQRFTPNTGAGEWTDDFRHKQGVQGKTYLESGVYNMGACPLPNNRVAFTSNRDGFRPAKGYPAVALQLFVMDDRDESIGEDETPGNLDKIGHFNLSGALHPVVLKDGRILFSSLESQGQRSSILWGIWTIHPDGTNWAPVVSAFDPGGAPNGFHFQSQLSDGSIIVEEYYNQNNSGFGALIKLPPSPPEGYAAFGPAYMRDERNKPWRYGRHDNGKGVFYRMPFMPTGSISLTPFTHGLEGPAPHSVLGDKKSPAVGKFSHPSGAPENHLLTSYTPGPANHQYKYLPQIDSGIYLLKNGAVVVSPAELRLIKNDPNYNECWPRAVVSYERIYGQKEPRTLAPLKNDGGKSPHLPAGTPFGLVGTASFYKRETYPNGVVPEGSVTSTYAGGNDPWKGLDAFTSHGNGPPLNWHNQGADAGLYSNDDIHAVRIIAMEPTTDRKGAHSGRRFYSHAHERLRILGEIPLRKFGEAGAGSQQQPLDPDGNPDTSFLARIPADTAFTFQTLDQEGMVLNAAQTWHQLRPGEIRNDCGGCHAHSQKPTEFSETFAARKEYALWDLTSSTPLLVDKARDESGKKWDQESQTGLKMATTGPHNVEYHRDIVPILKRSCVACHQGEKPAGNLRLDADQEVVSAEQVGNLPGTYYRLAHDERARFGHKPIGWDSWGTMNASRYIRKFQSRRSLLVWKIYGKRLDGFSNEDHPSEASPGDRETLLFQGKPVELQKFRARFDVDFLGAQMPPPEAVAAKKVQPLSDDDRRTLVRWIDLGCPIDLDFNPQDLAARGYGWMLDENRPILTVAVPQAGSNDRVERIVLGLHDYYSGLDLKSLRVVADFAIDGVAAGDNLASKFSTGSPGVWEWKLPSALAVPTGILTVSIRDRQGNIARVERRFEISHQAARR